MNQQVRQAADGYWDAVLTLKPLLATQVGDERFDDRLPDLSEAGRARAAATHEQALRRATELEAGALGGEERTTTCLTTTCRRPRTARDPASTT